MTAATCRWYALCDHEAVGTVEHPVLGAVPVCDRCQRKHDLEVLLPCGCPRVLGAVGRKTCPHDVIEVRP